MPSLVYFYGRQMVLPVWVALAHPLRPIPLSQAHWSNFVMPALGTVVFAAVLFLAARATRLDRVGALLLILTLVPTWNFTAYAWDDMVHDRYLYLPVAGLLIALFCWFYKYLEGARSRDPVCLATAVALSAAMLWAMIARLW